MPPPPPSNPSRDPDPSGDLPDPRGLRAEGALRDRGPARDAGSDADADGAGHVGMHSGSGEILVFDRAAIRAIDDGAREQFGLPTLVLMENAGAGLADEIIDRCVSDGIDDPVCRPVRPERPGPEGWAGRSGLDSGILLVCGTGHNGGDALCAARHLRNAGADVACVLVGDAGRLAPDTARHLAIAERMGIPVARCADGDGLQLVSPRACVVDALFGVGMDRPAAGVHADAIAAMRSWRDAGAVVVAVDLPSGLDADTGDVLGSCAGADVTVTMTGPKAGFVAWSAQALIGEVVVVDIGAPHELLRRHAAARGAAGRRDPG